MKCAARYSGLALDTRRQKLYYADFRESGKLGELTTDGTNHRVLITGDDCKPFAVAFDEDNR